jgi:ABC-type amino acid transport substrate-binding protein
MTVAVLATAFPDVEAAAQAVPDRSRSYLFGVDEDYAPFSYRDERTGKLTGFDAEIVRALCADMRLRCELVGAPFQDILPRVAEGALDVGATGYGITEARLELVDFTEKYFRSTTTFIQFGTSFSDVSPESLRGRRIAVQKDTIQAEYATSRYGALAAISVFEEFGGVVAALRAGDCDLGLVDGLPAFAFVRSDEGEGFDVAGDPLPLETEARMIVNKKLPTLTAGINAAIQRIRQNGVYDEINRRYFSFSVY